MEIQIDMNYLKYFCMILSIFFVSTIEAKSTYAFPLNILKNDQGRWRVLHIELDETSGPISPEFTYSHKIYIQAVRDGFFIFRSSSERNKLIPPKRRRINQNVYIEILSKLLRNDIHLLENEVLPETQILGVSYNSITYKMGTESKKFYYLLDELDRSENKQKKNIVRILKEIQP
ncbi:MAG: hypothetical protein MH321_07825 [Leptospiraceae bacterium]|nr:hypothetical protein [Leptospiraceae bacterium]